jgi:hypothetical protein
VEVQFQSLLTSELGGDEWLATRPGRFTPGKKPPVPTEYQDGCDLESSLHLQEINPFPPLWIRTPDNPFRSLVTIKREYSQNRTCVEKMVYSSIETTCFGLYWPSSGFYNTKEESLKAVRTVRGC